MNLERFGIYLKLTAKHVVKSMKNSAQWSALLGSLYMIAVDITSKIQGTPKRICITSGPISFGVSFY